MVTYHYFFELILQWFYKLVDILKSSMLVNTMYRDCVSVLYGVPCRQQLKQPIPCHLNNSGT